MKLDPDSGDSLSTGKDQVPTFNFSLPASFTHLIWLCLLQKTMLTDSCWENTSGTLPKPLKIYSGITEVGAFSCLLLTDIKTAAKQTNALR